MLQHQQLWEASPAAVYQRLTTFTIFSVLFFSSLQHYICEAQRFRIKRAEGRMVHIEPLIFSSFNALDVFPFHIYLLLLSIRPTTSRTVLWLLCTTAVCREKTFFAENVKEEKQPATLTVQHHVVLYIVVVGLQRKFSTIFFSLLFNGKRHSRSIYVPDCCPALKHSDSTTGRIYKEHIALRAFSSEKKTFNVESIFLCSTSQLLSLMND